MNQSFLLYTWHLPDWDVTQEKRKPSKGPQGWGEELWKQLQPLYEKLEEKIGPLDVLWCFTEYEHWNHHELRRLWVLDVPDSKIFHFLDSDIWGEMVYDVRNNRQIKYECWDQLVLKRTEGMKRLSSGNNAKVTPLVHVPLSHSIRVVDHSKFNKGPAYSNTSYDDLPISEYEAMKWISGEGYLIQVKN